MKDIGQTFNEVLRTAPQLVIIIPAIIMFTVLMLRRERRRAALLKCLAEALNAQISGWGSRRMSGEHKGLKYSIECFSGGKHEQSRLEISIYKGAPFDLRIQKETALHKIGKKINLLHEVEIYNEMFDKEFYISSKSPDQAANYLNKSFVTTAIKELSDRGFCSLTMDAGGILLKKTPLRIEQDLDLPNIITALDYLATLANEF